MSQPIEVEPRDSRELVLARRLDASPEALYRGWTEAALIVRWFTPPPWRTVEAQLDVRPGGASLIVMEGPDGTRVPNRGVYLEVTPGRRLVFTDAYVSAWTPAAAPFMTVELTFDPAPEGGTRYVARAAHWSEESRAQHEAMGFLQGWAVAADQLEAVARSL